MATRSPLPDLAQLPAKSHEPHRRRRHVRCRDRRFGCSHRDHPRPRPRRIIHFDVTQNPTQGWLARQIIEAFPWETAPRYLLRDRDRSYGQVFRDRICMMGIKEVVTAARSPWQNAYVERVIGSVRRECLDHVIICDEHHLRGVLSSYFHYYHKTRTHLSLAKDFRRADRYTRPLPARLSRSRRSGASIIATNDVRPNLWWWLYSCDGSGVEGCSVPQPCPPNAILPKTPL